MKKIITTLLLAVAALGTATQANAEGWYLGGNVGFMHESRKGVTTNEFSLQPEFGYNFSDRWAFGGSVGYTYRNYAGEDTNMNLFNINPYARFTYFRTSNNLVQLFVDGGVGFGIGSTSVGDNDTDTACTYEIGFKPGIAINITDHFTVLAHLGFLGYQGANDAAKDGGAVERGGVNFDTRNLTIGFYYNF